ncbi:MAG: flavin reductase [Flavobacteriales bacterium]|nr:flavin reductase [Flavobacteriales bacterium]
MLEIHPNKVSIKELHHYLLSSVAPRPIALASTIDLNGNKNISPFSFFNVFSANPPIAIFSPARRVRNNTTKDTLCNIQAVREVVINVVNFNLVEQTSLSSVEYSSEIDEFIKAGLTPVKSKKIKPFRVEESPIQMECKVTDIIELGKEGGAGNLIICKIVLIHINKNILNNEGQIDQNKLQLVGRMGSNWYSKGFDNALFEIEKPVKGIAIGFDQIPNWIKASPKFTRNDLTKLASVNTIPEKNKIEEFIKNNKILNFKNQSAIEEKAKGYLNSNEIELAWQCLLAYKLKL